MLLPIGLLNLVHITIPLSSEILWPNVCVPSILSSTRALLRMETTMNLLCH